MVTKKWPKQKKSDLPPFAARWVVFPHLPVVNQLRAFLIESKLLKVTESDWKRLKVIEDDWKWLRIIESTWKYLKVKLSESDGNRQKPTKNPWDDEGKPLKLPKTSFWYFAWNVGQNNTEGRAQKVLRTWGGKSLPKVFCTIQRPKCDGDWKGRVPKRFLARETLQNKEFGRWD